MNLKDCKTAPNHPGSWCDAHDQPVVDCLKEAIGELTKERDDAKMALSELEEGYALLSRDWADENHRAEVACAKAMAVIEAARGIGGPCQKIDDGGGRCIHNGAVFRLPCEYETLRAAIAAAEDFFQEKKRERK